MSGRARLAVLVVGLGACTPAEALVPTEAHGGVVSRSEAESSAVVGAGAAEVPRVDASATEPAGYVAVVVAPRAVELASPVAGTLVGQEAALGQSVTEGEVIARVQAPALPEQIEAGQAALASAEAGLAGARLRVVEARRELDRERSLVGRGASTVQAEDRARAVLEQAQSSVRERSARVSERAAQVRRLGALRDAGQVRAPFSGRVGAWFQAPGAVVAPGDALVRLTASEQLWVRFAVPAADVERLTVGMAVTVVPLGGRASASATIARISPELDLASQMIVVEARLDASTTLRAGQAGRVLLAAVPSTNFP